MRHKTLAVLILISAPLLSLPAQQVTGVREGQRVRITSVSNNDLTGVVSHVRVDSIVVFTEPTGAPMAIATADLRRVDVSHGRSMGEGAKRGAIWGGAIGAGLALLGGAAVASDNGRYGNNSEYGNNFAEFAANMIGGGLIWGAGIGAFVKSERWDHVAIQPRMGSSGVGVSIALH